MKTRCQSADFPSSFEANDLTISDIVDQRKDTFSDKLSKENEMMNAPSRDRGDSDTQFIISGIMWCTYIGFVHEKVTLIA